MNHQDVLDRLTTELFVDRGVPEYSFGPITGRSLRLRRFGTGWKAVGVRTLYIEALVRPLGEWITVESFNGKLRG